MILKGTFKGASHIIGFKRLSIGKLITHKLKA